jgi:hypothetical protein
MDRFYSQRNVERYRKLTDVSTDEAERGLILASLAGQADMMRMAADNELRVRVEQRGDRYLWQLHRNGHYQLVKFSAPVYRSEEAARASGSEARTIYLARLATDRAKVKRYSCTNGVG